MRRTPTTGPTLAIILASGAWLACGEDGGTGTPQSPLQASIEARLQAAFAATPGFIDAFNRLVVAANGGAADGVSITPAANGFNISAQVDTDGNGTRDATVNGTLTFSTANMTFAEGAIVNVSGDAGSVAGSVTSDGSSAQVDVISGSFTDTGDDLQVILSSGSLSVTSAGLVTGVVDDVGIFDLNEGEIVLFVDLTFQSDGAGGFEIRVTDDLGDIDFTVP